MPDFRVFFEGSATSLLFNAATPTEARAKAGALGTPIRKIKLDRETVDPCHRAPRLTRRELTRNDTPKEAIR